MMPTWRKGNTRAGLVVAGLLIATVAGGAALLPPPLPPVDAPLAPAPAGSRFAPELPPAPAADLSALPLPPASTGTHVTATLDRTNGTRLVAVWGDPRLWEQNGSKWRPAPLPALTGPAAEAIALTEDASDGVTVGTRRDGSFRVRGNRWESLPRPNAPRDANGQALAAYRGQLWVATLNDGLVVRDRNARWQHVAPPTISSLAPRQFVTWQGDLYVRHGSGVVDRYDGRHWTPNVFARLPRRQVSALATDGKTLFLAQWGGWSETSNGGAWVNRFPAELRNVPLTALLPVGGRLYVGTQGRGLAECDRDTGAVLRWHDERAGIGDDWITTLAQASNGSLYVGTWVSGAYHKADAAETWQPVPGTENDCVTGIVAASSGVRVSLRRGGVRRHPAENDSGASVTEAQCLLADAPNRLLWVGTRTGIVTVRHEVPTQPRP